MPSIETPWFQVAALKEKYGLVDFIETGCDKGVSLGIAQVMGFKQLLSCDVNPDNIAWAKRSVPGAEISHASSVEFLTNLVPYTSNPTLFWLDAHFAGPNDLVPEWEYPLYDELFTIARLKKDVQNDVILCDDICQIHSPDNPRYRPGECDWREGYRNSRPLADYVSLFAETHDYHVFEEDNGALLFTPTKYE